jgi:hypothetical protein
LLWRFAKKKNRPRKTPEGGTTRALLPGSTPDRGTIHGGSQAPAMSVTTPLVCK